MIVWSFEGVDGGPTWPGTYRDTWQRWEWEAAASGLSAAWRLGAMNLVWLADGPGSGWRVVAPHDVWATQAPIGRWRVGALELGE